MTVRIIAIEGVDGSGKTSVANQIALRLGGRCVKAFDGETGLRIRSLNEGNDRGAAEALARRAMRETLMRNDDARLLVFDRHWMSILVHISEEFAPNWHPYPPTLLVWADIARVIERLRARGTPPEELERLPRYAHRFDRLAEKFGLPRVETTDICAEEAADLAIARLELSAGTGSPSAP